MYGKTVTQSMHGKIGAIDRCLLEYFDPTKPKLNACWLIIYSI